MTKTQIVDWLIKTKDGATLQFTTVGYKDTSAALDRWLFKGHRVKADWRYV